MLVQSQKKRDTIKYFLPEGLVDDRIGNYKGSFNDWLARLSHTNTALMNSKGKVAKA